MPQSSPANTQWSVRECLLRRRCTYRREMAQMDGGYRVAIQIDRRSHRSVRVIFGRRDFRHKPYELMQHS
jgi:hypothetical protein